MSWTKPTPARKRVAAASMLTTLAVAVSGCTDDSGTAEDAGRSPSPTAKTTSPEPTATEPTGGETTSAETTTPSPTSEPTTTVETPTDVEAVGTVQPPSPGAGPREMLLRAREMPGLNDQHSWRTIATENSERRQPVWACQVTDLSSIGATDVWVRRFVGAPGGADSAKARSAVITFADTTSARRAYAVLRAWHDRCEETLSDDYRRVQVDAAPTAVDVDTGEAEWRLAIYGPAAGDKNASYFDATGYVREGNRISLTTMVSVGQDYNYPPGEEPIVGAVRNSAIKLLG